MARESEMMATGVSRKGLVTVRVNPEKPIGAQVLAESILEIAQGMRVLNDTRLSRKALVALIHENSKVARRDIEIVLNNLDSLEATWLKPRKL